MDGHLVASGDSKSATFTAHVIGTAVIDAASGGLGKMDSNTITVNPGPLAKFALALSSPEANGVAFSGVNTLTAQDAEGNTVTTFDASLDNVRITANAPLVEDVYGLGTGNNSVLNRATDFVAGVAELTALGTKFVGNHATGTFMATSATGKTGTSGNVTINGPGPGQPGKDMQVVAWLTIPASVSIAWGAGTTGKTAGDVRPFDWTVVDATGSQLGHGETCVSHDAIVIDQVIGAGAKAAAKWKLVDLSPQNRYELASLGMPPGAEGQLKRAFAGLLTLQSGPGDITAEKIRNRLDAASKGNCPAEKVEHVAGRLAAWERELAAKGLLAKILKTKDWEQAKALYADAKKDYSGTLTLASAQAEVDKRLAENMPPVFLSELQETEVRTKGSAGRGLAKRFYSSPVKSSRPRLRLRWMWMTRCPLSSIPTI